jgi:preprotein translocase subunit YajC
VEIVSILIFILPLALLWLFLVVPQQRRMREQRALLNQLEPGDEVMTTAGLYGRIVELSDDNMFLQVAPGVELKFARGAVARKLTESAPDEEEEEYDEDDDLADDEEEAEPPTDDQAGDVR